ncbi:DUF3572 domain-containing protein [Mangrovicoccus ximenensis]|uniref:DUF3572 domain-containing protein n=1 Tax=Mangrovicoccus ximenensis TaxID=1911570 RepID=UPI000D36928E|nr:DUF3572 domain-containing protein [Mangrovicoccus ximenensis]
MDLENASAVALGAISWMASEEDLLPVFLNASGLTAEGLKAGLEDPEIQAAILDFVLMDDSWVLAAAGHSGRNPLDFGRARQYLPGGAVPHWT